MRIGAPAAGWGAFVGAAIGASLAPMPVQLAFAAGAIGVVGMTHGAGNLAVVGVERRGRFMLLYALVSIVCLGWWIAAPASALPAFLIASAIHFGIEDAPAGLLAERGARGIGLVAATATLHHAELVRIVELGGVAPDVAPALVQGLAWFGGLAAVALIGLAVARGDRRLLVGIAALLALPPLVGFSVGFLILHALPQTRARARRLGRPDTAAYLLTVWPVLLAAVVLLGLVGAVLLPSDPSGMRPLFAGIAALAVPHLLVTPWFERREAPGVAARSLPGTGRLA